MQTAIGVRFKRTGKIEYYRPGAASVQKGDWVIAETTRGLECGEIVLGPSEIVADGIQLRCIRRRATPNDLIKHADNRKHEQEAFLICKEKIAERKLPMKLIGVEFTFDVNKIIFSFTSEGRVDFRDLVRDLAYVFRTRIELRQVGVRDETKVMGGIGNCGRPLCCASFLGDFVAVSIRMAKEQNLSLNPAKISGCCGRLMCCLQYEDDNYHGNCNFCRGESTINNINAEDDQAAAAKLEELEIEEEQLENIAPSPVENKVDKPFERRGDGRHNDRREGDRRESERRGSTGNRERGARPGNRFSTKPQSTAQSTTPPSDPGKKPPQKNKPRSKRSAYQRDKNFHSRRPNVDDA